MGKGGITMFWRQKLIDENARKDSEIRVKDRNIDSLKDQAFERNQQLQQYKQIFGDINTQIPDVCINLKKLGSTRVGI